MHASQDMACREILQLLPGLDEEAAVRDADRDAPPISQPHKEAREPGFAMYGKQVEVVVEARIATAQGAVLPQVCPCSSKP